MAERSINDLPADYVPKMDLPDGYVPSTKEEYMCDEHLEYFRRRIEQWKEDLLKESNETIANLRSEARDISDEAERASRETENTFELRTRDRYRKLLKKINKALDRFKTGDYGYCEETGEPISIKRLKARPVATLTLEAQERHERMEKTHRDD